MTKLKEKKAADKQESAQIKLEKRRRNPAVIEGIKLYSPVISRKYISKIKKYRIP